MGILFYRIKSFILTKKSFSEESAVDVDWHFKIVNYFDFQGNQQQS